MRYVATNDQITVIHLGEVRAVTKDAPNFSALRAALLRGDYAAVPALLALSDDVELWSGGKFDVSGGRVRYLGAPVEPSFGERVLAVRKEGGDAAPLLRFWEKLARNPSQNSVAQLFKFMQNAGIPIAGDGSILAYKGVRGDYRDEHTGTHDNRPGSAHRMPREAVEENPDKHCAPGFHVGSEAYAKNFAARVVICRADPADAVSVPSDHNAQKMRVCAYSVVGDYGEQLPSTTLAESLESAADAANYERLNALPASELVKLSVAELRQFIDCGLRVVGRAKARSRAALAEQIVRLR